MSNPPKYSTARVAIPSPTYELMDSEYFCVPVIHLMIGKIISKYKELANDPDTREVWITASGKESGGLAHGDSKTGEKGRSTICLMNHDGIKNFPADRKITYRRLVVNQREQKTKPN